MKKKIIKLIICIILVLLLSVGIALSDKANCILISALLGSLVTIFFEKAWKTCEDLKDTTNWKISQRQYLRGGMIKNDTLVRISFSYLYRIKIDDEYLLIRNARGTRKYQPIGGVYKMQDPERIIINNLYHVVDDDKIKKDQSSKDDYRLYIPSKYLRKFMKRFDRDDVHREKINDLSREFKEEMGDYLAWDKIRYRYCGRDITKLQYDEYFQCYELLLADVVDLLLTNDQIKDIEKLRICKKEFKFAKAKEINSLGVDGGKDRLYESIADHSKKILQENEQYLLNIKGVGEIYEVNL